LMGFALEGARQVVPNCPQVSRPVRRHDTDSLVECAAYLPERQPQLDGRAVPLVRADPLKGLPP
jgi:hypothetical protein